MSPSRDAHDPSVRDYADTSPREAWGGDYERHFRRRLLRLKWRAPANQLLSPNAAFFTSSVVGAEGAGVH